MIWAMFLAHLLGDYVFQTDRLAGWKQRSAWGVLVHGTIVTFCLWLCALPFTLHWWPYALGIGLAHTLIDLVRAHLVRPAGGGRGLAPKVDLALFVADQVAHALTIFAGLAWFGRLSPRPAETAFGQWLQAEHRLTFITAYVLLTMPAWVSVHFVVRGMGAVRTSLPGRPGEKYVGMIERGLIATFVLLGQFVLVPLVVAPRLALDGYHIRLRRGARQGCGLMGAEGMSYLNELLVSVMLAVGVGLFLRGLC